MQLYEKYRPKKIEDFIGQETIKKRLARITSRTDWDRDAFWIQGPSGTGKTTLAWIIALQVAKEFFVVEMDGDKCNVESVRQLEQDLWITAPDSWRVIIINEAHAMTGRAVQAWLTLLERLQKHTLVIFTTTQILKAEDLFGDYSGPFGSRCKVFTFSKNGLSERFAVRAREIAVAEGLDGLPLQKYQWQVMIAKNNMRTVLQKIDAGEFIAEDQEKPPTNQIIKKLQAKNKNKNRKGKKSENGQSRTKKRN